MQSDLPERKYGYMVVGEFSTDGPVTTTTFYDRYGRVIDPAAPPLPPPTEPLPPMEPMHRLFTHTFEFRLLGAEAQQLRTYLPRLPRTDRIVVTTDLVRTFITRSGAPAAPSNLIGGVGGIDHATCRQAAGL
jgi:hypothetical protein